MVGESIGARARYVLVIRVPREIENRIEDLFLGLSGTTKPVMGYHITLVGPFLLRDGADPDLPEVTRICQGYAPFEVELTDLGAFQQINSNAVYVNLADPSHVIRLHEDLMAALAHVIEFADERSLQWNTHSYHPHVTLALGLSDKALEAFPLGNIGHRCHSSFIADAIWLVAQRPNEPWRHLTCYALNASPSAPPPDPDDGPCAAEWSY